MSHVLGISNKETIIKFSSVINVVTHTVRGANSVLIFDWRFLPKLFGIFSCFLDSRPRIKFKLCEFCFVSFFIILFIKKKITFITKTATAKAIIASYAILAKPNINA